MNFESSFKYDTTQMIINDEKFWNVFSTLRIIHIKGLVNHNLDELAIYLKGSLKRAEHYDSEEKKDTFNQLLKEMSCFVPWYISNFSINILSNLKKDLENNFINRQYSGWASIIRAEFGGFVAHKSVDVVFNTFQAGKCYVMNCPNRIDLYGDITQARIIYQCTQDIRNYVLASRDKLGNEISKVKQMCQEIMNLSQVNLNTINTINETLTVKLNTLAQSCVGMEKLIKDCQDKVLREILRGHKENNGVMNEIINKLGLPKEPFEQCHNWDIWEYVPVVIDTISTFL